jgi:hypothetical protein
MDDEIVKEIHDTRRRIFQQCDGDIDRLIERLKAAESADVDRLVTMEDVQKRKAESNAPL